MARTLHFMLATAFLGGAGSGISLVGLGSDLFEPVVALAQVSTRAPQQTMSDASGTLPGAAAPHTQLPDTHAAEVNQPNSRLGLWAQVAQAGNQQPAATPPPGLIKNRVERDGGPGSQDASTRLARSLQAELQRVGCYTGEIDCVWGDASRVAMAAFNKRIHASLPIDQPDYVLLTLLQGHSAQACGATCPLGQSLGTSGACLPNTVVAESRKQPGTSEVPGTIASSSWTQVLASALSARPVPPEPKLVASGQSRESLVERRSNRLQQIELARKQEAEQLAREANARRIAETEARAVAVAERQRIAVAERRRQELFRTSRPGANETTSPGNSGERGRLEQAAQDKKEVLAALIASRPNSQPAIALPRRPKVRRTALNDKAMHSGSTPSGGVRAPQTQAWATGSISQASPPNSWTVDPTPPVGARPSNPRFVSRFMPPPTYRVGRLPRPVSVRGAKRIDRQRVTRSRASAVRGVSDSTLDIFRRLERFSP